MSSLRDQLAELLQRIKDEARRIYPGGILEIETADGYVLSMYWRSVRLFDGIVLLLRKRLPEESLILARSLFVDALPKQLMLSQRKCLILKRSRRAVANPRIERTACQRRFAPLTRLLRRNVMRVF